MLREKGFHVFDKPFFPCLLIDLTEGRGHHLLHDGRYFCISYSMLIMQFFLFQFISVLVTTFMFGRICDLQTWISENLMNVYFSLLVETVAHV